MVLAGDPQQLCASLRSPVYRYHTTHNVQHTAHNTQHAQRANMRTSFIPYAHEIIYFLPSNFRILSYFSPLARSYSLTILTSIDYANMKSCLLYSFVCYCLSPSLLQRCSFSFLSFFSFPFHNLPFSNPVPVHVYVRTHFL